MYLQYKSCLCRLDVELEWRDTFPFLYRIKWETHLMNFDPTSLNLNVHAPLIENLLKVKQRFES